MRRSLKERMEPQRQDGPPILSHAALYLRPMSNDRQWVALGGVYDVTEKATLKISLEGAKLERCLTFDAGGSGWMRQMARAFPVPSYTTEAANTLADTMSLPVVKVNWEQGLNGPLIVAGDDHAAILLTRGRAWFAPVALLFRFGHEEGEQEDSQLDLPLVDWSPAGQIEDLMLYSQGEEWSEMSSWEKSHYPLDIAVDVKRTQEVTVSGAIWRKPLLGH